MGNVLILQGPKPWFVKYLVDQLQIYIYSTSREVLGQFDGLGSTHADYHVISIGP